MKKNISAENAVAKIPEGATIMFGGFMGDGAPHRLIDELIRQGRGNLKIISSDTARPDYGVGRLIAAGLARSLIASHIGTNPETQRQMLAGTLEVELVPQGTLAERIRAGGYGLGGVLTPTGVGTVVADGKPTVAVDGRTFLVEKPLRADFAFVAAAQADYLGNLSYTLTMRNFNPLMAMAADTVIAEAAAIVPVGAMPPDEVVTPFVVVDYLVSGA